MKKQVLIVITLLAPFILAAQLLNSGVHIHIAPGTLVSVDGNLEINNGEITILEGSSLFLAENSTLSINSGGKLNVLGINSLPAVITSPGYFALEVNPGGTIGGSFALFEKTGTNGLYIKSGGMIDPDRPLSHSTFRNGQAGGALFTIDNDQEITLTGVNFPSNLWNGSYNVVKNVDEGMVTFQDAVGGFSGGAFENDVFNRIFWGNLLLTHNITLTAGWSGLSSYIMPQNTQMDDVFEPVSGELIIAQTMNALYYPSAGINTIGAWGSQSTYQVKMSSEAVLPVTGFEEANRDLLVSAGWNLIPVICNNPVNAASLFEPVISDVKIVKEVAGNRIYWPEFGINTLQQLIPGKAYFVKMNSQSMITFPQNSDDKYNPVSEKPAELFTPWNGITYTSSNHIFGFTVMAMKGIEPGDIIGIFTPEGICAGNIQIGAEPENVALVAYSDDVTTAEKDGYVQGDEILFKLFRPSTGEEWPLTAIFDDSQPNYDGTFVAEGISVISQLSRNATSIPDNFPEILIFPNPTTNLVTIQNITGFETVRLFSSNGIQVKEIDVRGQKKVEIDFSGLQPGFYQLMFIGETMCVNRKIVRL